ncbi:hypothetical protein AB6A40_006390 [Gnathostoma spinigerum]|uniref:Uncharacterized protein n=1 Tax=Gnathostoma spinigerum TaxID=75299 RepID=A0ABD6EKC1_9BILA
MERLSSTADQKTPPMQLPNALAFASLRNFKIPKVTENEKCESPTQSLPTTTSTPSTTSSVAPTISTAPLPAPISSSIFPPKPTKSILKCPVPEPNIMFRPMGMPPGAPSGRRPLLPDPRMIPHHQPRQMMPRIPPAMPPNMIPPPSAGRWMSLAAQKLPTTKPPPLEPPTSFTNDSKSPEASSISKASDSPTEGLKIVADDE